jgi:hypothetical protein
MGRYRAVTTYETLPASLEVYAAQLQEYAAAQDDGHAFFGEAVYPERERLDRAPMFYPINVDPPDPASELLLERPLLPAAAAGMYVVKPLVSPASLTLVCMTLTDNTYFMLSPWIPTFASCSCSAHPSAVGVHRP